MEETFGQRLSRIRKEKGLTQEDIAKRIVISPQAVSKWENDVSSPDILVLSSLADILGISVDELLGHKMNGEATKGEDVDSEVVDDDNKYQEDNDSNDKEENNSDKEDKKKTHVNIGIDGIHVIDGDDEVHVSTKGIYVREGDHVVHDGDFKASFKEHKSFWITQGSLFGLALVGYILMGLLWADQNMGWAMGWILFLLPPVFVSIFEAIRKRKFCEFLIPLAITAAYCTLGFLGMYLGFEGWGFYWFLFIIIPAYYLIFGPIDNYIHRNDTVIINDVIDNEDDEDDD